MLKLTKGDALSNVYNLILYIYANYIASAYGHWSTDYHSAGNSVTLKLTKGDTLSNVYNLILYIYANYIA